MLFIDNGTVKKISNINNYYWWPYQLDKSNN